MGALILLVIGIALCLVKNTDMGFGVALILGSIVAFGAIGLVIYYSQKKAENEKLEKETWRKKYPDLYQQALSEARKELANSYFSDEYNSNGTIIPGYKKKEQAIQGRADSKYSALVQKKEIEEKQELAKKEAERKKLEEEQRIIREKTEAITQANKHIDEKINQYRILTKKASADKEEEASCQALIGLLKSICETNVNKTLSGYKDFAEIVHKKCEIREEVEKVAGLYIDIGNPTAANELLGRLKQ